jgi:hypothetical protein
MSSGLTTAGCKYRLVETSVILADWLRPVIERSDGTWRAIEKGVAIPPSTVRPTHLVPLPFYRH